MFEYSQPDHRLMAWASCSSDRLSFFRLSFIRVSRRLARSPGDKPKAVYMIPLTRHLLVLWFLASALFSCHSIEEIGERVLHLPIRRNAQRRSKGRSGHVSRVGLGDVFDV